MYDESIDYFGPHKKLEKPKKIKSFPSFDVDRYLKKHGHLPCKPKPKKIFDDFCLGVVVTGLIYIFIHIVFWKF